MGRKIPEIITEQELLQMLKACKHKHHKIAFLLGFYECMRISEIVGLGKEITHCCKADIVKSRIRNEYGNKVMERACAKCGADVPVSQIRRSTSELQIHPLTKDNIREGFILLKDAKGGKDRTIPIAKEIERHLSKLPVSISVRALEMAFKKLGKEVLDRDLHFHCLRHSGATHYLNVKKWSIRLVQQFLGHSNLNTTQLYTHVQPDDLLKAMRGEI